MVKGQTYQWERGSTYVKNPPYFDGMAMKPSPVADIRSARILPREFYCTHRNSTRANNLAKAPAVPRAFVDEIICENKTQKCSRNRAFFFQNGTIFWHVRRAVRRTRRQG